MVWMIWRQWVLEELSRLVVDSWLLCRTEFIPFPLGNGRSTE